MHTSIHSGGTGIIRHSPRSGFNSLFRALPGAPGFLATVTCMTRKRRRKLSISVGMPGPHGLAVRIRVVRRRANSALQLRHVHRIPRPTFVTTAKRPSSRARDVSSKHQFRKKRKRNIFRGRTGKGKRLEAASKISFSAHAIFGHREAFSCAASIKIEIDSPVDGQITSQRWRRGNAV